MDFDLSTQQRRRLHGLTELDLPTFSGAPLLDNFLVIEELARRGIASDTALRGLLDDLVPDDVAPGPVAITEAHRRGPVRYAGDAAAIVVLDADEARLYDREDAGCVPSRSSFGYPHAHVTPRGPGRALSPGVGAAFRSRWRLALIAEIAGNADAAVSRTADHLAARIQFGHPLSSFQALRHRLADVAVSVEATRWLGREAAQRNEVRSITRAAWYASDTAATAVPELVQMCGARSFTHEFGLHVFTMRLNCLRLELGGSDRLATSLGQLPIDDDAPLRDVVARRLRGTPP